MAAHGERQRLQADHAAGLAGRTLRLRAPVHQQPGLPEVQEESRPADHGAPRLADCRATTPARNGILASRRIRLRVMAHRSRAGATTGTATEAAPGSEAAPDAAASKGGPGG